ALHEQAETVQPRRAGLRRAARDRLDVQVLAAGLEACRIHEVDDLQRADLHRVGLSRERDRDDAVAADRHALRARRDRDRGLERVAARRYELTVRVELKRPVAGIGLRAVWQPDPEEAPALDRDVTRVVRRDE